MIFTLAMILEEMKDLAPVCNQKGRKNQDIQGMFLYRDGQTQFHKNSIYLCTAEELRSWDNRDEKVVFFSSGLLLSEIRHVKNYCYIFENVSSGMEISNRYMQLQAEYSFWDREIHLDIINSCSLEKMLDYASQIIEYPIQIYDSGFRTLATSKHHRRDISGFRQAFELGYTPPDFISEVQKRHMLPKIQEEGHILVAPAISNPDFYNLYRSHKADGQLLGYSCVFCGEERPPQGYLDKAELVMQNLDFYFKENQKHVVLSKYMYESFLVSLLSSRLSIHSQIVVDRARVMHLPLRGEFVLIQMNFTEKEHFASYLCRLIQTYLPDDSVFVYEDYIYLLMSGEIPDGSIEVRVKEQLRYLKTMMPSYHFSACVSNLFYELTAVYDACQICLRLEAMRERFSLGTGIYTFREWQGILHYLQYGEDVNLTFLLLPEIRKIEWYDEKYHTHYLETLDAYFYGNCNLKKAAEIMNLHRNSFANRIDKIRELFGLELEDFRTCWQVYGTLQVRKVMRGIEGNFLPGE